MSKVLAAEPHEAIAAPQGRVSREAVTVHSPDVHIPNEEDSDPAPSGACCNRCLSSDLVPSRRSGFLAGVARLFGYRTYRCRRCLSRTLW